MSDIIEYLESKNIEFRPEGAEVILTCPECSREKLYINTNSHLFHCFYCEACNPESPYAQGHFSQLQELWGDIIPITPISLPKPKNKEDRNFTNIVNRYKDELKNNSDALRYIMKRGITEESIDKFNLGYAFFDNQGWLSIPSYEDKIPKLIKYRKLPPETNTEKPKYIREVNSKSILFNSCALDEYDDAIIVEGEIDSITLIQNGYENVVGITGGAGTLLPEWYDKLYMKKKLYLVFDADTAGQSAAQKVWATRLGKDKCWNIVLPDGEDVNSYFLKHTKEDFDLLIKEAHLFKVEGIMSLGDAIHEIYKRSQENDESGFLLPWDNVNRLISNGVNRRDLVIIGGPGNVGKTSLTLQIMDNFVEVYNVPSLYFCLEMPETALATKIIQLREDMVYNEVAPSDVLSYYDKLKDLPMYFGYSARVTPELFYNTVREVRNRYGVGLVIFDNIQLMIRSGEEKDLSQASKLFKNMAMDLDIVVIMISQPRKLNSESSNITYDDLKGTSAFSQDADIILLMHRKRSLGEENTFSFAEKTTVIADKVRLAGGGRTKLKFIGAKSKFVEYEKGEE